MTFQQLNYLLEVNKVGSFSVAARNLFVSQSAVSNAIIALEKEIGAPLFVRGKKLLTPTARGEEVIEHANHIFERFHSITHPKRPHKKSVCIGSVGYSPANAAFIKLLEENRGRDDIDFSFIDTRFGSFIDKLIAHEIDIAISFHINSFTSYRFEEYQKHGLVLHKLAIVPAAICIGPGHRLYNAENIDVAEFAKERLLDTSKDGFAAIGVLPAYIPVNRNNILVACGKEVRQDILMRGHAYSINYMPSKKIRNESPLRYIPIEGLSYTVYAATNPNHPHCTEIDRYIELLKREIATAQV